MDNPGLGFNLSANSEINLRKIDIVIALSIFIYIYIQYSDQTSEMSTGDRKGKAPASKAAHHLSAGALSGFTSAIILQPLDLLKTRLQQDSHEVVGFKRYVHLP
jgi:hypothetical protein